MKASGATNQPKCAAKMESDSGCGVQRHHLRTAGAAIPFALCVASVAFCIVLGIQTSDIKTRMLDLERSAGERVLHPFAEVSMGEFNSMVQERVDEVLSQLRRGTVTL
ncbi:collagen alpha-1(XXV) chain isoform X3 [Clarias magur]|uniref:Collagen alpha-1(XXV) chain isoform X3 n=1 Tax=Clarias magur TaxID=1594786 RepID=A0A8J4U650_CLAMG|nr:collagen alpha-1(XXV) chain isoform X3 [Clarias magur]